MESLSKRLDKLTEKFNDDDFLANKGLSNEVGIHIFCYEPNEEMIVQHYVEQLKANSNIKANIIECDLYEIFLKICEGKRILDRIPKMEEIKEQKQFQTLISQFATPQAFIEKMEYGEQKQNDVLLLTGIGKVYPYMRCNNILESIQSVFPNIPVVVLYPGKYTSQNLVLFNKFSTNYYRAFSLI
jgi:hypothetical protein